MKFRGGFVSNSSSSSFIILKKNISDKQIEQIINHIDVSEEINLKTPSDKKIFEYNDPLDAWDVDETTEYITVSTIIDNFDMEDFFKLIGVSDYEYRIF